jgi:hypothetical protein
LTFCTQTVKSSVYQPADQSVDSLFELRLRDVNLARSHQTLGGRNERVRDGVHILNSPMAHERLNDERLKRVVGSTGNWPCKAVRGVYEFHAVRAFGYHGERPTELCLKKARQGRVQGLALVQRLSSLVETFCVKFIDNGPKNILLARKVVVNCGTRNSRAGRDVGYARALETKAQEGCARAIQDAASAVKGLVMVVAHGPNHTVWSNLQH